MRVHGIINILNFPILLDFKKWLTQTKSLLLCECVLEKYFGPNRSRHRKQEEKRKFTLTLRERRREGKRKLQEKRRRNGDRRTLCREEASPRSSTHSQEADDTKEWTQEVRDHSCTVRNLGQLGGS